MIKSLIIKPYNDIKVRVLGFKLDFRMALRVLLVSIFLAFLGALVAYFTPYKEEARLFQHLVAGIFIPFIAFYIFGYFYRCCAFYLAWSVLSELQDYWQKGFFQFDQFAVDLLGMVIAILFYKKKIEK